MVDAEDDPPRRPMKSGAFRNTPAPTFEVLDDASCKRLRPLQWAARVAALAKQRGADRVVAEVLEAMQLAYGSQGAEVGISKVDHGPEGMGIELSVALGGSITGEHGVGIEKINQMCVQYKTPELEAFRRIKGALDERGLLNPGKAVPSLHRCAEYGRMHVHHGDVKFPELERF